MPDRVAPLFQVTLQGARSRAVCSISLSGLLVLSFACNQASPAKKTQAEKRPAPVAVAQAAPPPPPPPPPSAVEARKPAVEPAAAKPKRVKSKSSGKRKVDSNCGGECAGDNRVTAELQRSLRAKAGLARSCYNRALSESDSDLSGSLTVNVRVGRDGAACRASIGADTLGNPGVSRCVTQRFLAAPFPKPNGGCVDVAIPINFVSQ